MRRRLFALLSSLVELVSGTEGERFFLTASRGLRAMTRDKQSPMRA
jgi:hypothetical protein